MQKRRLLVTLTAGAALTVAGCATPGPERTANPPPPEQVEPPEPIEPGNPPPPDMDELDVQVAPPETLDQDVGTATPALDINTNPPPPDPNRTVPTVAPLPTWDEVESGHPKGATNPPMPELVVTPSGDCFKAWRSPMAPSSIPHGDRVQESCDADCGTPIQCPDKAKDLLDAHERQVQ